MLFELNCAEDIRKKNIKVKVYKAMICVRVREMNVLPEGPLQLNIRARGRE